MNRLKSESIMLPLSFQSWMVIFSAANERAWYTDEEASRGLSPDRGQARRVLDAFHLLAGTEDFKHPPVTINRALVPTLLQLIPASMALLDDDERQSRTMEEPADFTAAQAELEGLLAAAGYVPDTRT